MSLWLVDQNAKSHNVNHNITKLQRSYSEVCKQTTVYTWEENKQMTIHSVHVYRVLVSSWGRVLPQTAVPTHSWSPHKARPDTQQVCLSLLEYIGSKTHSASRYGGGVSLFTQATRQAGMATTLGESSWFSRSLPPWKEQPSSWRSPIKFAGARSHIIEVCIAN